MAPRPLREAVANPTPENLQKYAAWQARRLVVLAEFNEKLAAQSLPKAMVLEGGKETSPQRGEEVSPTVSLRDVNLLYFYQSSCPHCLAERDHVEGLRRRGVQVTFVQLDAGEHQPLHHPSVPYSAELASQFAITATPTWILRRREQTVRLQGEQSEQELQAALAELFQPAQRPNPGAGTSQGVAK